MFKVLYAPEKGLKETLWVESSIEPVKRAIGNEQMFVPVYARTTSDGEVGSYVLHGSRIVSIIESVDYPHRPAYAADLAVFSRVDGAWYVLLIQRPDDDEAFPGAWALPGGGVHEDETAHQASLRETTEETGVDAGWFAPLRLVGVYDAPRRDPRGRVVSVAYATTTDGQPHPTVGHDVADAEWVQLRDAMDSVTLAFDHATILRDAYTVVAG